MDWTEFINYTGTTVIPEYVKEIAPEAYRECSDLTDVEISDGIESIEEEAFAECSKLKSISIPASVKSIGAGAFAGCSKLEKIVVDDSNPYFKSVDNCCLTKDGTKVVFGCKAAKIPDGVIEIGDYAFWGMGGDSLELPTSVIKIGDFALAINNSRTSIELPKSLESIGTHAFFNWNELKSIEIPASVRYIGENAFLGCVRLEDIKICEGIKVIGKGAFADCAVKKIRIPSSINKIEEHAFYGCHIRDIYLAAATDKYEWAPTDFKISGLIFDFSRIAELNKLAGQEEKNCYNCTLHVPEGTGKEYRNHPFFRDFKEIVED